MAYIKTYQVCIQPFLLTIFGPINKGPRNSTAVQ